MTRTLATVPRPEPRLERAQVVWERAGELLEPADRHDLLDSAIDLLRVAHHDPATMAHALVLGQTESRAHHDDDNARAVRLLRRAIAFLGTPREDGEVGGRR